MVEIDYLLEREVMDLSGGELQRPLRRRAAEVGVMDLSGGELFSLPVLGCSLPHSDPTQEQESSPHYPMHTVLAMDLSSSFLRQFILSPFLSSPRFAILVSAILDAHIFMFDEPSSYLDVKQRLAASQVIRSLLKEDKYIIVVEHDLAVLDYLSDFVCCLWGSPGAYGVVSMPSSVREGRAS